MSEPYGRGCETGRSEIRQVLAAGESAGDAAHVRAALSTLDRSEMILRDDIADSDSTTRHEHSVHLADDLRLGSGQVDDAIADHMPVPTSRRSCRLRKQNRLARPSELTAAHQSRRQTQGRGRVHPREVRRQRLDYHNRGWPPRLPQVTRRAPPRCRERHRRSHLPQAQSVHNTKLRHRRGRRRNRHRNTRLGPLFPRL